MRKFLIAGVLLAVTGCGGGGGSTSSLPATQVTTVAPTAAPTVAPTVAPTLGPTSAPTLAPVLQSATLLGSAGFVAPNGFTVYMLSSDTFGASNCTAASGCTGLWPVLSPPAGATLSGNWSSFVRASDGKTQLTFNGNPLYTYAGDSAGGQTNGNGIVSFGGTWSIARPTTGNAPASAGAAQPTATPVINTGGY